MTMASPYAEIRAAVAFLLQGKGTRVWLLTITSATIHEIWTNLFCHFGLERREDLTLDH